MQGDIPVLTNHPHHKMQTADQSISINDLPLGSYKSAHYYTQKLDRDFESTWAAPDLQPAKL
jgi:hypothetical protein